MSATAPGRRESNRAHNRAAILCAAREVFAELGYDAAGVREITRRTELASGTFYNYFQGKEAVFRAVVEESAGQLRSRLSAARAEADSLTAFVADSYRELFAFLVEDGLTSQLLARNAAAIRSLFGDPVLGAGTEELLEDLRAGIARGRLPAIDADYLAAAMSGIALEVGVRMACREPPDVAGAARFATALVLGGIERMAAAEC